MSKFILDNHNRKIDYIRISVTDSCNLACNYCRKTSDVGHAKYGVSYEDLFKFCEGAALAGIKKIKITGGEPLLREGIVEFIEKLYTIKGIEQVTLTTNGIFLEDKLEALKKAKIAAINISLDTLDKQKYMEITGKDLLKTVLSAINKSIELGIKTKINTVVMKDINDDELVDIAKIGTNHNIDIRFIELMPLGFGRKFSRMNGDEVLEILTKQYGEFTLSADKGNGPAKYYENENFEGHIGFISAVSHAFCGECNRVRLTPNGYIQLCLAEGNMIDLKELIKDSTKEEIAEKFIEVVKQKPLKHHFDEVDKYTKRRMWQIGG